MTKVLLPVLFCFILSAAQSQMAWRLHFKKMGITREMEIYPGDNMEYKLKGDRRWKEAKILALGDSIFYCDNSQELALCDIKCIKIKADNFLLRKFQHFFGAGAIFFLGLDTFNNILLSRPTIVHPRALAISGGLLGTWALLRRAGYRKVRFKKNFFVIPITTRFTDLAAK